MEKRTFYAHGKLLLTGEYLVLEGARALAVPVNRGQFLQIAPLSGPQKATLQWTALHPAGLWFNATYTLPELSLTETSHRELAQKLAAILSTARSLNPAFLDGSRSFRVETRLEFDTGFGLGSSSTLVANLAAWAQVDAFALQWKALGGSGYDIACAKADGPLFYQIVNNQPVTEPVAWKPPFRNNLFFVYLGHKQRSDQSIKKFKQQAVFSEKSIQTVSEIGENLVKTKTLSGFEKLLQEHEAILSKVLGIPPVQQKLFKNYPGTVKSLGAWGGDFVLVTSHQSKETLSEEMKSRGYPTLFSWDDLVWHA